MNIDNCKGPTNEPPTPTLSPQDQAALSELLRKQQLILDRVVGVARQYIFGLIITGRGGIGKSCTRDGGIAATRASDYILHNSHLTARGLFDELKAHPDGNPHHRGRRAIDPQSGRPWNPPLGNLAGTP